MRVLSKGESFFSGYFTLCRRVFYPAGMTLFWESFFIPLPCPKIQAGRGILDLSNAVGAAFYFCKWDSIAFFVRTPVCWALIL